MPLLFITLSEVKRMRSLQTTDVFSAIRLINKIGVREEIKQVARMVEEKPGKKLRADAGVDLLLGILERAATQQGETEIYIFISELLECEPDEVRTMDPITLMENLEKVADIERWKNFFGYVKRLIMKK